MKFNINIIVGGVENVPIYLVDAARIVRTELKKTFENFEIAALYKLDICLCFSGNTSKYYSKSGVYQPRYYLKTKKFIVSIHFNPEEWSLHRKEDEWKFLEMYQNYLLELSTIMKKKMEDNKLEFDESRYQDTIKKIFLNLRI